MKVHQRQVILLVSSRYQTGFGGVDNLKYRQKTLVVLTNLIWYSFYFTRLPLEKGFQRVLYHWTSICPSLVSVCSTGIKPTMVMFILHIQNLFMVTTGK